MRMIQQHLRMIGITHILRAQAVHNTGGGQPGNRAGKFVSVFGQCPASIVVCLVLKNGSGSGA